MTTIDQTGWWNVELEGMAQFNKAVQRIYAWFEGAIIDRAPIRFQAHNAFVDDANVAYPGTLKQRWFDSEFQVDTYMKSIQGKTFRAETFPVFWPNLGPEVYAAFYGSELEYGEVTAWSVPLVKDWSEVDKVKLNWNSEYFTELDDLTRCALDKCKGKALVGYTDMHPGVDCAAAWRRPEQFCMDLIDEPEQCKQLIELAIADFEAIYTHFDDVLKAHGQPSVSWMGIPTYGRMHIPSCDFSSLLSCHMFDEFCLPVLQREVKTTTHNVFHVDGRGVARHIDRILDEPGVHAIQWVQGVGDDMPIMQWVPFIKEIQARRPVIVDLKKTELEPFMEAVRPEGIFLWVASDSDEEEEAMLRLVEKWK